MDSAHTCACVPACASVTRGQSPLPGSEQLGAGPGLVSLPQPQEVLGLPQEPFAHWFSYALLPLLTVPLRWALLSPAYQQGN